MNRHFFSVAAILNVLFVFELFAAAAATASPASGGASDAAFTQHLAQLDHRQLVANSESDPTGYNTLKRVLGEIDMQAFQEKWEKFMLGLWGPSGVH